MINAILCGLFFSYFANGFVKFIKQRNGKLLNSGRCKLFCRLIQQHHLVIAAGFLQQMLVEPVRLAQTAFNVISVCGFLKIAFGNRYAEFKNILALSVFQIYQTQRIFGYGLPVGEQARNGFAALEFIGFWISVRHWAKIRYLGMLQIRVEKL